MVGVAVVTEEIEPGEQDGYVAGKAVARTDVPAGLAVHVLHPDRVLPLLDQPAGAVSPELSPPRVGGLAPHRLGGDHRAR
jgi:hypothetical protein